MLGELERALLEPYLASRAFDPAKHPRIPSGKGGGRWTSAPGAGRGRKEGGPWSRAGDVVTYHNNLGVDRADMPQLSGLDADGQYHSTAEMMPQFIARLRAQGIHVRQRRVKASSLKPTQTTGDMPAIRSIADELKSGDLADTKPITISLDGRVLDGHHNWAGRLLADSEGGRADLAPGMPVVQVGLPISELMKQARAFGAEHGIGRRGAGVHANPAYAGRAGFNPMQHPRIAKGHHGGGQFAHLDGGSSQHPSVEATGAVPSVSDLARMVGNLQAQFEDERTRMRSEHAAEMDRVTQQMRFEQSRLVELSKRTEEVATVSDERRQEIIKSLVNVLALVAVGLLTVAVAGMALPPLAIAGVAVGPLLGSETFHAIHAQVRKRKIARRPVSPAVARAVGQAATRDQIVAELARLIVKMLGVTPAEAEPVADGLIARAEAERGPLPAGPVIRGVVMDDEAIFRSGHWKHEWIPLDFAAAQEKFHHNVPAGWQAGDVRKRRGPGPGAGVAAKAHVPKRTGENRLSAAGGTVAPVQVKSWDQLRERPASDLKVGDQFFNPSMGSVVATDKQGRPSEGRGGWTGPEGTTWKVTGRDGDQVTAVSSEGKTLTQSIPPGKKVLHVIPQSPTESGKAAQPVQVKAGIAGSGAAHPRGATHPAERYPQWGSPKNPGTARKMEQAQAAMEAGNTVAADRLLAEADSLEAHEGVPSGTGSRGVIEAALQANRRRAAGESNAKGLQHSIALAHAQRVHLADTVGMDVSRLLSPKSLKGVDPAARARAENALMAGDFAQVDAILAAEQARLEKSTIGGVRRDARWVGEVRGQVAAKAKRAKAAYPALNQLSKNADGSLNVIDHAGREYKMAYRDGEVWVSHGGKALRAPAPDAAGATDVARRLAGELVGEKPPAPRKPSPARAAKAAQTNAELQAKVDALLHQATTAERDAAGEFPGSWAKQQHARTAKRKRQQAAKLAQQIRAAS